MPEKKPQHRLADKFTIAGKEVCDALKSAAKIALSWKWYYLAAAILLTPLLFFFMRYDPALSAAVRTDDPTAVALARRLSAIGRTDGMTLWLSAGLLLSAWIFHKARIARVAICLLLAVLISGIGINIMRPSFGRARPYSAEAGTFHGPTVGHEFNGFPSGHSSEACAIATVVGFACPPAAIPAAIYAGGVIWSRMTLGQHFPMDVAGGAFWGIACALPFGVIARRKKTQA